MNNIDKLIKAIESNNSILIVQAENPDGDSLSSSLALESIFVDLDKNPIMHCAVGMPEHLKHLPGWDRVNAVIEENFEIVLILDTANSSLLQKTNELIGGKISSKPVYVIDHHKTESDITYDATLIIDSKSVSTGEIIYKIAKQANWPISVETAKMLASSILYDSLGLMTEGTTSESIRIIAELVDIGVSLPELDEKRRELMKRDAEITKYKGELITRIQYAIDGKMAYIHIPWEEIEEYSSKYNPSMLVIDEMRMTTGVQIAIAFKTYPDGKLTAKIKSNYGFAYARKLAEHFSGGGHDYAAGFKLQPGNLDETINKTIEFLLKEEEF